jgi:hypothetical protein
MADTYDMFIINVVVEIMNDSHTITPFYETMIKVSALLGSIVGNLKIYKTVQFYIILSVSFYILNKV